MYLPALLCAEILPGWGLWRSRAFCHNCHEFICSTVSGKHYALEVIHHHLIFHSSHPIFRKHPWALGCGLCKRSWKAKPQMKYGLCRWMESPNLKWLAQYPYHMWCKKYLVKDRGDWERLSRASNGRFIYFTYEVKDLLMHSSLPWWKGVLKGVWAWGKRPSLILPATASLDQSRMPTPCPVDLLLMLIPIRKMKIRNMVA